MTWNENQSTMNLYRKIFPSEIRYWIYKLRHRKEFEALLTANYPSDKGDFSLVPYSEKKSIFVHITKAAGTSLALSVFGKLPYHYTARQYRVIFGRKRFNAFYKFTFVRNPWDRLYSAYSYLKGGGWNAEDAQWAQDNLSEFDNFNDFVLNWLTPERLYSHIHLWPQLDFICDDRKRPIIDELFYFESIEDGFQAISRRIGVENELSHTNASKRVGYRDVYSKEAIDKVALLYAEDIHCLGYEFSKYEKKSIINKEFVSS